MPDTAYTVSAQEMVTSTADPAGNTQTAAYNARGNVTVTTNALSGGTTTNTWGSNAGESLTSTATPAGAKPTAAFTNTMTAADPTAQYLPTSSTNAQANVTAYIPDGAGPAARPPTPTTPCTS